MIWLIPCVVVLWLLLHNLKRPQAFQTFDFFYCFVLIALFCFFGQWPYKEWQFEKRLSEISQILADGKTADVDCISVARTVFIRDGGMRTWGTGNPISGEIKLLPKGCDAIQAYLKNPATANKQALFGLNLITHEAMHARGERQEHVAECQAVQRNLRTARLLGVPEELAQRSAVDYYRHVYPEHGKYNSPYFSSECKPGGKLDERLPDSTFLFLRTVAPRENGIP